MLRPGAGAPLPLLGLRFVWREKRNALASLAGPPTRLSSHELWLALFVGVCQAEGMKKQASDQSFHDRRYQERKRAEAARKAPKKKVAAESGKQSSESRVPSTE